MPTINLLPWREELRQKRKKDFILAAFAAVLMGAALTLGTKLYYGAKISNQEQRNGMLRTEIKQLDAQIAEIRDLESKRQRLLDRTQVIQELERSRPETVTLMDALVDVVPPGTYLTQVQQQGKRVDLKGWTQSSTRVSALMRRINDAAWLRKPQLGEIEYAGQDPTSPGQFTVTASQIAMGEDEEGSPQ